MVSEWTPQRRNECEAAGGQEEFEVMNKQLNKTGDVVDSMTTQLRHKELEVWREVPVRC